jgi:Rieske Fe-S protein
MQQLSTEHPASSISQSIGPETLRNGVKRRSFLYTLSASIVGAVAVVVPFAAGLVTFFAPLGRRSKGSQVRVCAIEDIPPDGIPRRFPVIAGRRDAWNVYPPKPIGAVFLRRTGSDALPQAVSSVCPHLGCAVDFRMQLGRYQCPCHNSAWQPDGSRIDPSTSPSPRDLDGLKVEVRDGQVWVDYQRFKSGVAEQVQA